MKTRIRSFTPRPFTIASTPMHRVLIVLTIVANTMFVSAQTIQLTAWNTLSSLRTTRDADIDAMGTIWAATSGGIYSYAVDGTIREYRNVSALQSLSTSSILCDRSREEVIVGAEDGALDILQSNSSWLNITDIKRASQYPKRGIRDLVVHNDVLYIATDFGFVTYDLDNRLFIETIDRIGSLQENTRANSIAIINDSIWVATDSGLAVAPMNVSTLRLPSIWRIYGTNDGLPSLAVSKIVAHNGSIVAACGNELFRWNGTTFTSLGSLPKPIRGLASSNGTLSASTEEGVYVDGTKLSIPWANVLLGHAALHVNGLSTTIGFVLDQGIQTWDGTEVNTITINSPLSNQFARLSIDSKGALWVATDVDPPRTGQGVAVLSDGKWTTANASTNQQLATNACYRVSSIGDGEVMVGTWGGGAYRASLESNAIQFRQYTSSNSAFQGIPNSENYVLASDAVKDRSGNIWMINEQSVSTLFVKISSNETTAGYSNCFDSRNNLYRAIAVDGAGNKWAGSTSGAGLVAYNEKGTADRADDICNVIRTSNSQLPDNVISALRIDKTGGLWIGTAKGVAVISGPTGVSNSAIPYVRRITALSAVVVNDIYVDALNYKWIATTSGVYVLNEDGTSVLSIITKSNSPLLDDNVRTVVVDDRSGIAYFGTSVGCSYVQTSSIQPTASFELAFRPQPFELDKDNEVVIDGLAEDAEILIMTTGGILVHAFQARGRQASWDGKDTRGNNVPPGVYIVHASSATAGTSAVGKVMVKR